jgi:cephalosporin hydroxylase
MIKTPMDAWTYQELLFELRPEIVVELGTYAGGTALFLAQLMDIIGHGRVIGVENDLARVHPKAASHPRVTILGGRAQQLVADVRALVAGASPVLVIDDASHVYESTLDNCRAYGELVTPGSYLIVEDTICHHGLDEGPRPGPYEAVGRFLEEDDRFVADRTRESFGLTWNPKRFLRRIR